MSKATETMDQAVQAMRIKTGKYLIFALAEEEYEIGGLTKSNKYVYYVTNEGELNMEQIIVVIKNGNKTTRLGDDAVNSLKNIKLNHQTSTFETFAKDVTRKVLMARRVSREPMV